MGELLQVTKPKSEFGNRTRNLKWSKNRKGEEKYERRGDYLLNRPDRPTNPIQRDVSNFTSGVHNNINHMMHPGESSSAGDSNWRSSTRGLDWGAAVKTGNIMMRSNSSGSEALRENYKKRGKNKK